MKHKQGYVKSYPCFFAQKNMLIFVTIDKFKNLPKNIEKTSNEMDCP